MSEESKIKLHGPFAVKERPEFLGYFVTGLYRGHQGGVCFIIEAEEEQKKVIGENYAKLFDIAFDWASAKFLKWDEIPCYLAYLFSEADHSKKLTVRPSLQCNEDLCLQAEAFLRNLKVRRYTVNDNETMQITESVENGMKRFVLQKTGEKIAYPGFINRRQEEKERGQAPCRGEETEPQILNILTELEPELKKVDIDLYCQEIIAFSQAGEYQQQFRSFFRLIDILHSMDAEITPMLLQIGSVMLEDFVRNGLYDYADYIAVWVSDYAVKMEKYEIACKAWRMAAIANECLGRLSEVRRNYENAFKYIETIQDLRLKANIYMSCGISIVVLTIHLEPEYQDSPVSKEKYGGLLSLAENSLLTAVRIMEDLDTAAKKQGAADEGLKRSRQAIGLDLLRLQYLKGECQEAYAGIRKIAAGQDGVTDFKLRLTMLVYYLLMLKRLQNKDVQFQNKLKQSVAELKPDLAQYASIRSYLSCVLLDTVGQMLCSQGEYADALQLFQWALDIQFKLVKNNIRPANPADSFGGVFALDIAGRMMETAALRYRLDKDKKLLWKAFVAIEEAKGKFFRRDLMFGINPQLMGDCSYETEKFFKFRDSLSGIKDDHRLIRAEYDWSLKHDLDPESLPDGFNDILTEKPLTEKQVRQILKEVDVKAAVVSFYAAENKTVIVIYRNTDKKAFCIEIDVLADELRAILKNMQNGISGGGRYSPINPRHPEQRDKYFMPFAELQKKLAPVVKYLTTVQLIIIVPHSMWHSLPLNALFMPLLWQKKLFPGVVYVPCFRIIDFIRRRDKMTALLSLRNAAITVVPADNDPLPLFQEAFEKYRQLFKDCGIPSLASFGGQGDADRLYEDLQMVGMHHILAHGLFAKSDNAMDSAILLAKDGALPVRGEFSACEIINMKGTLATGTKIMFNSTSAGHVTVQACSLGLSNSGQDNEFWGFTRALISAGAGSVLAPLWDIDLESSTRFLELFYEYWLTKKQPKWQAWVNAQYEMYVNSERKEWNHFYHWASFIMVGW